MFYLKFPEDNVTNQKGYSDFLVDWLTPEFNKNYEIPSKAENPSYICNPYSKICSCDYVSNYLPEKAEYIANAPHSHLDIRLFCRHMAAAVLPQHPNGWDDFDFTDLNISNLKQELLNFPFRDLRYRREIILSTEVIVGFDIDSHWVSLYVPNKNSGFSRYRFNLLHNEWGGGDSPTGYARAARDLFMELFDRRGSPKATMFEAEVRQMEIAMEEFPDQADRYEQIKGVVAQLIASGTDYGLIKWYEVEKNGRFEINLILANG